MGFSISAFGLAEGDLPLGWIADRFDTIALLNPEQISDGYPYSEIAYLDIANVGAGAAGEPTRVSLANAPSRAKRIARMNDSILSTVRPGNRAYAFLRNIPGNLIVSTGFVVLRSKPNAADPRFIYYLATSDPLVKYLASIAEEKTAYPSVNPSDIAECIVPIPPLPEQRAIAHILGTLDDKIELNQRMNKTLEAMARALFKSWFVDFDPVRAKADGRDPGISKLLAELFPARLVDSELGKIPEGWEIGQLEDVLTLQRGFDLPASARTPGPYPVIAASGPGGWHNQFMVRGPGVITGRSGVLGNVFYVHADFWPLNTSLWVKEFKRSTPAYAFHLLRQLDLTIFNAGSAVPTLNRNHVHDLPTLTPPIDLIHAFDATAVPLLKRQRTNDDESRNLGALRDALLSKLVSGEVRVKNAEKFIQGAV